MIFVPFSHFLSPFSLGTLSLPNPTPSNWKMNSMNFTYLLDASVSVCNTATALWSNLLSLFQYGHSLISSLQHFIFSFATGLSRWGMYSSIPLAFLHLKHFHGLSVSSILTFSKVFLWYSTSQSQFPFFHSSQSALPTFPLFQILSSSISLQQREGLPGILTNQGIARYN